MAQKAPGKHFRKGMSIIDLIRMFPNDETAEQWFIQQRWGDEIACIRCGSCNVNEKTAHKTMPHRCRDCDKRFSVKLGTAMEASNLGYQVWAIAMYLMSTNIKGISSMKLHRDLEIGQKAAWFLAHRIRESFADGNMMKFFGPVEVDETYIGGRESNKHEHKKLHAGRGMVGKTAVVGAKDRETNRVTAKVVEKTDAETLQGFVLDNALFGTTLYTDDHKAYSGLEYIYDHGTVKHSVGEYVNEQIHTNGMESFWSMLKRGITGTYHKMSKKHLGRYINEFTGRHNTRPMDTLEQMQDVFRGMEGKRLRYVDLIA